MLERRRVDNVGVRRADHYELLLAPNVVYALAWTIGGRAGSSVASVTIEAPGVGDVTPTNKGGWFLAWWPATSNDYSIVGR